MEHTVPPTKMITHNLYLQNHLQDIDRGSSKTELITEHTVLTLPGKTGQQLFLSQISSWYIYNWVHKPEMLPSLRGPKSGILLKPHESLITPKIISEFKFVTPQLQPLKVKDINVRFHFRSCTFLPVLGKGSWMLFGGSTSLLVRPRETQWQH